MAASRFVEVSDKEISEIKINSVLKNTKGLCKNTKTIVHVRLRLSDYRGIFTSYKLYSSTYTARQLYNFTALQHYSSVYSPTTLQPCAFTTPPLQRYNSTALQLCSLRTLELYNSTALQLYNSTASSRVLQLYSSQPEIQALI